METEVSQQVVCQRVLLGSAPVDKKGGERSRTGQGKKLSCSASPWRSWPTLCGALKVRCPFGVGLTGEGLGLYTPH